jgi:hypothetical protein
LPCFCELLGSLHSYSWPQNTCYTSYLVRACWLTQAIFHLQPCYYQNKAGVESRVECALIDQCEISNCVYMLTSKRCVNTLPPGLSAPSTTTTL